MVTKVSPLRQRLANPDKTRSERLERLETQKKALQDEINAIDGIEGEFGGNLWQFLVKKINREIHQIDKDLRNFKELPVEHRSLLLERKNCKLEVLELQDYPKMRDAFTEKLNEVIAHIDELNVAK